MMHHRLVRTEELTHGDRAAMFRLLQTHFDGVRIDIFNADLADKNWVILIDNEIGQLQGFSTLRIYQTHVQHQLVNVVYSGDTIMDPSAWQSSVLSRAWVQSIQTLRAMYPVGELYWLLISSGYRTYRFLPVFWQEFYPRYDQPTPAVMQNLIHQLAQERFGSAYDRDRGIVQFHHPHQLKGQLKGIPAERLRDRHIQFFEQQNPGHLNGDELVCLAKICEDNLTRAGRRIWFNQAAATTAQTPLTIP